MLIDRALSTGKSALFVALIEITKAVASADNSILSIWLQHDWKLLVAVINPTLQQMLAKTFLNFIQS